MSSVRARRDASRVKDRDSFAGNQGDLFQQLEQPQPEPGDLDIHFELLGALTYAIRQCRARGISRERIVDRMNQLMPELDKPITLRQLNAWTAASKEYSEFPARFLAAFCAATECDLPARRIVQPIGRDLVDHRGLVAKELVEAEIEAARLKQRARDLRREL